MYCSIVSNTVVTVTVLLKFVGPNPAILYIDLFQYLLDKSKLLCAYIFTLLQITSIYSLLCNSRDNFSIPNFLACCPYFLTAVFDFINHEDWLAFILMYKSVGLQISRISLELFWKSTNNWGLSHSIHNFFKL